VNIAAWTARCGDPAKRINSHYIEGISGARCYTNNYDGLGQSDEKG
jgi:hypothetical protein